MQSANVAIIGFGTVGTGVARILLESGDALAARAGLRLNLKYICDTDLARPRGVQVPQGILTDSLDRVLADGDIRIVCELVGGTTIAYDIVEKALKAGKDVVTANKALLAERGMPLLKLAAERGRSIAFEASVAGGIPLILSVRDGLVANRISAVTGIVNGTCNYILTSMTEGGISYEQALAEAQQKGYAEADPTLDVSGGDSAHKLTILSWLAFGAPVRFEDVYCEGIQRIQPADIQFALELGYRVKLLAIGERNEDGRLSLRVHPAFVPRSNPLAHVGGAYNAVTVHGDAVGDTLYYGLGAGQMPTASAVVADLVDTALGRTAITFKHRRLFDEAAASAVRGIEDIESRYYLRFEVLDRPGVLASITGILGRHDISISSCLQHEPIDATHVPLIIMSHLAREGNIRRALAEIETLETVRREPAMIRVIDQERP
ncbi:MAG: homoserine dehydrogenase [Planctomycetes bacterium]|nr:homoserine dehydrogenase [Planctomycetota bacterium]